MRTVQDLMTTPVTTLGRNDELSIADEVMTTTRIRHLPVLNDRGRLVCTTSLSHARRPHPRVIAPLLVVVSRHCMRRILVARWPPARELASCSPMGCTISTAPSWLRWPTRSGRPVLRASTDEPRPI